MSDLLNVSATTLATRIRNKEVSSEEVVNAHLQRIEAVNPKLNAVVQLAAERAQTEARQADAALARGEIKGPLHGVPITVKDRTGLKISYHQLEFRGLCHNCQHEQRETRE